MTEIEKLIAIEAIKQVEARYIRFMDTRKWSDYETVFCGDVTADYRDSTRDPVSGRTIEAALGQVESRREQNLFVGAQRVAHGVRDAVGSAATVHHVFSPEIEITSTTTARGVWALEDIIRWPGSTEGSSRGIHGFGHYYETYKCVAGNWLIQTVYVTRLLIDFF